MGSSFSSDQAIDIHRDAASRPWRGRFGFSGGVAVLATVLAAGCASLQRPEPPLATPVPLAWSAAVAAGEARPATALDRWWLAFGDPTLNTLIDAALARSTDVEAARARLRQSRAARDLAAAALGPSLGATASAQASRSEGRATAEQFRAGFDAGWEADLWGSRRTGVAAATADLEASAGTLGQVQVTLAAEVASTYVELRSAQQRLELTRANLDNQQHLLRIVQWRHEAGLVTRLDVEQQRGAVAQTQAQIPALETSAAQAAHALAVLAGAAPGTLERDLAARLQAPAGDSAKAAEPATVPVPPAELVLDIPAAVLARRPDLRAAAARVRAAAARVEQADAARLPSLQLSGSIGLNALDFARLVPGTGVASLAASLNLPLLDGGRIAAQVRAQEAALAEARVAERAALLGALQEVEDALVALAGTRAQRERLADAADAARRAASLAAHRYAGGLVDYPTVLATQRTQLAADDAVATATAALAIQHVRLVKALGGGWTPDAVNPDGSGLARLEPAPGSQAAAASSTPRP